MEIVDGLSASTAGSDEEDRSTSGMLPFCGSSSDRSGLRILYWKATAWGRLGRPQD